MKNRYFAFLMAAAMLVAVCSGCSSDAQEKSTNTQPSSSTSASNQAGSSGVAQASAEDAGYFPLDEPVTLSIYRSIDKALLQYYDDWNDTYIWKELQARTNVHLDWTLSSDAVSAEISIIVASGDYPDLFGSMEGYAGKTTGAFQDGVIYDLTDYVNDYMPNYKAVVESDNRYEAVAMQDDGSYLCICQLTSLDVSPNVGFVMRGDWLDGMGWDYHDVLTYDAWYEVLKGFKVEYGAKSPLWISNYGGVMESILSSGYGIFTDCSDKKMPIIKRDGRIVFTPFEKDSFIPYLEMLQKWYGEGLINQDYLSGTILLTDISTIAGNQSGTWVTYVDYMHNYDEYVDEGFYLVPVYNPVLSAGQPNYISKGISYGEKNGLSISTACTEVEVACRFIDYLYSEEGRILSNYGVEGVSFNMVDGEYVITELVTEDERNIGWLEYTINRFYTVIEFSRMFSTYDEYQHEALDMWGTATDDYVVTDDVSLTAEELSEFSALWADIKTLTSEFINGFIVGSVTAEDYDRYVETAKSLNVDRCVALYQQALDRYLLRISA